MSHSKWFFKKQIPGYRDRNPIQGEFFASESIGADGSALIREGLQNSGDAVSPASRAPVTVRIFVSGDAHALEGERLSFWSKNLWKHIDAAGNGLRDKPGKDDSCPFLLFEDFGTTGLEGATDKDMQSQEPFYCFFRAENATSKKESEGGSWGVGKSAFASASRVNAMLALSTRESDKRSVLMGSLTLKTHYVDGHKFTPDAWFGTREANCRDEGGGVIQPLEETAILDCFRQDFHLVRGRTGLHGYSGEGTSIVVPWSRDVINQKAITESVIRSNFLPIINGKLIVRIGTTTEPGDDQVIDSDTIASLVDKLETDPAEKQHLQDSIRLARWSVQQGTEECVTLVHESDPDVGTNARLNWSQYSLPEVQRLSLREKFDADQPIMIRVPVPMRIKRSKDIETGHIDVAMIRSESANTNRPVFVRGSVVVPDRGIKRAANALAIIHSQQDELERLLRAAEDPGHKEWSTKTDNFYDFEKKYAYASSYIRMARESALQAFRQLQDNDAEEDLDLLGDVFSLTKPPEEKGKKPGRKGRKKRRTVPPDVPPLKRSPSLVRLEKVSGGFRVSPSADASETPKEIVVRAAYDCQKGDPFKSWDRLDFDFGSDDFRIVRSHGLVLTERAGNRIGIEITDTNYELVLDGFEPERADVVIRVRSEGRLDA